MDLQEQIPDDSGAILVGNEEPTKRDALSGVDRTLQLADLNHSGVQKLVLDRLDRAEARVLEHGRYRQDYHDTREKLVVAESSLKPMPVLIHDKRHISQKAFHTRSLLAKKFFNLLAYHRVIKASRRITCNESGKKRAG
jgi:hypothetical protein